MKKSEKITAARMFVKSAFFKKIYSFTVKQSAEKRIRFPKLSCLFVKVRRDKFLIIRQVSGVFAAAEKVEKVRLSRQILKRGDFQTKQINMMPVQVDRRY